MKLPNLNAQQRATVEQLVAQHKRVHGLAVCVSPTTRPARFVEVRINHATGRQNFWQVEQDGKIGMVGTR